MHSPLPQGPQRAGGLYDVASMLPRLDKHFQSHDQELNEYDKDRKILLREAILNNDFFYPVLSQVFSLYTLRNSCVAHELVVIPELSWSCLGELLCSNESLSSSAVQLFSKFPASVEIILCSGWKQFFLYQLDIVKRFLLRLPGQWDCMQNISKASLAPPLVQDMVEVYNLTSPVIQTTVFRAMARSFWGRDDPGLRFLEVLHKLDQDTYTKEHWKRTEEEKDVARRILRYVYDVWQDYLPRPGAETEQFMLQNVLDFFRKLPPSMQPTTDINNVDSGSGHFSRGTAQKAVSGEYGGGSRANNSSSIQAVAGTDSMGVVNPCRRRTLTLVPEQQRMLVEKDNNARAQQLLLKSSRQHQWHHTRSFCQQQLGSPSAHITLPIHSAVPPPDPLNHRPLSREAPHMETLIPSANAPVRPLPVQPDTARMSLHQAHLRSPVPGNRQLLAGSQPLYQHVTGYPLALTPVNSERCAQHIKLFLSEVDLISVPRTLPSLQPGEPGIRTLKEGSTLYRLRCCKMPPGERFGTEASWVAAVNTWPDIYTFQLNGRYLEPRRRFHCLPIDLSTLLQVETNILSVYTVPKPSAPNTDSYVVAIEQVSVWSHASIISAIKLISAEDSLAAIKRSLENPSDEDDDIAITSSNLTISLFEPYQNDRIYDTPVRGSACLHRECFDLETFLSQCEREQPGYPCVPDCWRCPICKGDVRPQTLVRDGFLVQVKEELVRKGLLGTRAIIVEVDGSWKPKVEARLSEVRTASLGCEEAAAAPVMMAAATSSRSPVSAGGQGRSGVVEVVVLD
ncbi:hypothetical protein Q7P35_005539 [Cladosporium inversicolor]